MDLSLGRSKVSSFCPHTELELCLGARHEVTCVAANISFRFLLLGPFAQVQSREVMEGQVTGGGKSGCPLPDYPSNS